MEMDNCASEPANQTPNFCVHDLSVWPTVLTSLCIGSSLVSWSDSREIIRRLEDRDGLPLQDPVVARPYRALAAGAYGAGFDGRDGAHGWP